MGIKIKYIFLITNHSIIGGFSNSYLSYHLGIAT